ncbi:MAG: response regulator transcription factor [Saprospiraceae bacterium]|nr:response regulator transcription factor [Saprospiraceae bacterium]
MPESLKVLIVEDDAIISQLIEHHLDEFGHQALDISYNSERALDLIHNLKPDLIMLDINIEGIRDGIDIASIIDEKYEIPYIFITALSDKSTLERAQKVKPLAYLVKPFRAEDLRASIAIGMSNYKRRVNNDPLTLDRINEDSLSPLSEKEYDILVELSKGLSNKQIGLALDLATNTVKWHTQNLYSKIGVKNRTAAAQWLVNLD